MAHDTSPANLISKAKPDCHTIRHDATRSTRYHVTRYQQRHTIRHARRSDTIYNATRSRLTGMAHDMTGRQAGRTHGGKESLFSVRLDGITGLPHHA
jgi:hypothetical protein